MISIKNLAVSGLGLAMIFSTAVAAEPETSFDKNLELQNAMRQCVDFTMQDSYFSGAPHRLPSGPEEVEIIKASQIMTLDLPYCNRQNI